MMAKDRRAPIQRRIERLQKRLDNWDGADEGWSRAELSALQWALGRDKVLAEIEALLQEYDLNNLDDLRTRLEDSHIMIADEDPAIGEPMSGDDV